jgi:hypothetical protein
METSKQIIHLITAGSMLLVSNIVTAQTKDAIVEMSNPYATSIGIRYGDEKGISIKQFTGSTAALELMLSKDGYYDAHRITLLYEVQKLVKHTKQIYWVFGVGTHVSFYKPKNNQSKVSSAYYDSRGIYHETDKRVNYPSAGFDGMIGIEYLVKKIPLTLRLDTKPNYNMIENRIQYLNGGISVNYILLKKKYT